MWSFFRCMRGSESLVKEMFVWLGDFKNDGENWVRVKLEFYLGWLWGSIWWFSEGEFKLNISTMEICETRRTNMQLLL